MTIHLFHGDDYLSPSEVPSPTKVPEGTWLHLDTGKGTPLWARAQIDDSVSWAPIQLWQNIPLNDVPKELRLKLLILGG